ncbi:beta-lactamase family protein [Croceibacterium sp. LX-88]|uniref:Beta-lactamase family protein n=1 Tax=Croceibacterium selenioxidans TaxID=2838833 RepID=A0ABS5VZY7_9SPHN|nr:serine hydrolase domain-containing protein [Croceibacterium selenioxidans]MBT2133088.1 beta-lactamase family protein [Croceibacterium selenioxidans]
MTTSSATIRTEKDGSSAQIHPADHLAREVFKAGPAKAPALSLAVARADEVVWAAAYGKSNLEFDVPATTAHLFRLGSVSKAVTATAAAKLVSSGVIDLKAPISAWLPDLPKHHRATTMKELLTHQGGVRHYLAKDFDIKAPGGAIYARAYPTNGDILALFIEDPLIARPGTSVSYSSYGYSLASIVMEAAADLPFLELIQREIARPFALPSLTEDAPLTVLPLRASGYMIEFERNMFFDQLAVEARPRLSDGYINIPTNNPAYCWAGAGLLMTPSDAARFGAAHLASPNSRISGAERKLLFTPLTKATTNSPPLGLGWRVDVDKSGRLRWHHAGATPGGRFGLVIYPDLGLSIAMGSNLMVSPGDVLGPASRLADIFT